MEGEEGMLRKIISLSAVLCLVAVSTGCATIVAGGPDTAMVNSKPEGARVSLDGYPCGTTPCTVTFKRDCEGILTFEHPGYRKHMVDIDKTLNGWFVGNILFGGLIGIGIDLVASNQGKYPGDPVFVELEPVGP
jgi:hypothetical protein